ncbi:hypothetical protein [Bradyrhizobium sp. SEMIA]|uniref:hypothetical protein n=1 Tax=Bradyrhizobium sp. SEMIA TaxID=2597515 RepID=UPI0018A52B06|nr:hypothetical protein [Bradyrhizobium sp. SEMIA]QOG17645.1 hypothetical protein FOM02_10100 [Bradyrhizobium sp. SEMIA]
MSARIFAACLAAALLLGCSIHPVPEDVTGVNTYHIVRQIRCEAREAIKSVVLERLDALARHDDKIAQDVLQRYQDDPESIADFTPAVFRGPQYEAVRHAFNVIYSAAIAYNFDLTMTEDNNLGTTINTIGPWTQRFNLGLGGNANRQRSNERTFTISDTFDFLMRTLNRPGQVRKQRYCEGFIVTQANYVYPIAGRIGVDKSVRTFLELTYFGNLAGDKDNPGGSNAPNMADKLTFTTTLDATATPMVTFTPVSAGFQVADASITGTARRSDVHQVTIGLAILPSSVTEVAAIRSYVFSREVGVPAVASRNATTGAPITVGNRVTAVTTTLAEKYAVWAIDQLKSRELQLIPAR